MNSRPWFAMLLVGSLLTTGCSKSASPSPASEQSTHAHAHHPPHGGTPVVLGAELYHLELALDPASGRLSAYVLDGEMEEFIRITQPTLEIVATVGVEQKALSLSAIANPATGETIGNTSLFEVQADWLRTTKSFDAVITRIEIRGTAFTAVAFNFPKGNDHD